MKKSNNKKEKRDRRHARIRAKVTGTSDKPRISIFKSNTTIYAQLIDDSIGKTIAAVSSKSVKGNTGMERAHAVGMELAKKAVASKVKHAVFDRGGFIYTGNVKAIADGAREGGLIF